MAKDILWSATLSQLCNPFVAAGPEGGRTLAHGLEGLTSHSLLFDILLCADQPGQCGGLIETALSQSNDGDPFMRQDQDGSLVECAVCFETMHFSNGKATAIAALPSSLIFSLLASKLWNQPAAN